MGWWPGAVSRGLRQGSDGAMAKIDDLSKGDRVRWGTSQGKTEGKVVGIKTKPFSIKGTDLKASTDKPKVVVESERSGARAGHKPSALQKLEAKASGKGGDAGAKKASGKKGGTEKGGTKRSGTKKR